MIRGREVIQNFWLKLSIVLKCILSDLLHFLKENARFEPVYRMLLWIPRSIRPNKAKHDGVIVDLSISFDTRNLTDR